MSPGEFAMWVAHEQWRMEQLSHDIAGRLATGRQCREAAEVFERMTEHLRRYADELDGTNVVDGDTDA
ncbi:hypothetical protein SAMN04487820_110221 [Actinopolyspora mzabensis]|uniref:Uncharacterized protein n=1 Tax=Actinopolyspora mzabensis TaxID=995066 RepID=A0A1G9DPF3_ACTMZ|nr:hypothetical protein [Actinopolyspora mzabensis]SDK65754.1 hypothetical protein SAMN04487820_110221 [Actinopolyspora mzabensis]